MHPDGRMEHLTAKGVPLRNKRGVDAIADLAAVMFWHEVRTAMGFARALPVFANSYELLRPNSFLVEIFIATATGSVSGRVWS